MPQIKIKYYPSKDAIEVGRYTRECTCDAYEHGSKYHSMGCKLEGATVEPGEDFSE